MLDQGELESLVRGFLKKPEEVTINKRNTIVDKTQESLKMGNAKIIIPGGGPFNQDDFLRIAGEPISPKERAPSRGSRAGSRYKHLRT